MPAEIILRFAKIENKDADFGVPVPMTVHYGDSDTESFNFVNPLTDKALTELRWYIERYYYWPQEPDHIRAAELEKGLREMGSALFNAVFKKLPDAMRLYTDMLRDRSKGATLTIDSTEPRILRLPWELIADEGGYLFSKKPQVNVRRRLHKVAKAKQHAFDLPARVLMVISRPDEAGFIDPRSSAEPMLDALDELGDQVIVEFLRPPTLATLTRRLRDPRLPPVHVVHFDGHGVYDKGIGLGFLLFEDDEHKKDLVDAERLGSLLNECGIPLMILDACQSSTPDDRNPFASVAARLIESGVGGVVAMNYSVLVETSKRITKYFYKAMAAGQSVSAALDIARLELLMDTKRLTLHRGEHTQTISLQDWFVPVLYQQPNELVPFKPLPRVTTPIGEGEKTLQAGVAIRDSNVQIGGDITGRDKVNVSIGDVAENANVNVSIKVEDRPSSAMMGATPENKVASKKRVRVRVGFPPSPQHGFHGRARELLNLERAFADHRIVVLHGYGGQGKTALATHAAQWFTRTGLFERAMFLSFESGAGLEWAINTLGEALVSADFRSHTDMNKKIAMLAESLKTTPTLIVWDNFESIMAKGDVPLPADELKTLLEAGAEWLGLNKGDERGGGDTVRSRLLITTRDVSFESLTYQPGKRCKHIQLGGLESSDAMELAAEILTARDVPRPPRESLARLLNFLGGHPLSIQLVLPALRSTPDVEEMIANFETLLPGFTQGAGVERNESLNVSLRFSLRRLGAGAQEALPRLAIFQGGAIEHVLLAITEIDKDLWATIKPELANASLIRIEEIAGVTVPYIHFHPTLVPYLRQSDQPSTLSQSPLAIRYWQTYYGFANELYQTDSQHPMIARALAVREMPNLRRALRMAIESGAMDEAVQFTNRINSFLNYFGRWRERDEVLSDLKTALARASVSGERALTRGQYTFARTQAEQLRLTARLIEAEDVLRRLLIQLEGNPNFNEHDIVLILADLGRCLFNAGRNYDAISQYEQCLNRLAKAEENYDNWRQLSMCHGELATVLGQQGRYDIAEQHYLQAISCSEKINDVRGIAVELGNLGNLLVRRGRLQDARQKLFQSKERFHVLGEPREEAVDWFNLGGIAATLGEWDDAEKCYKECMQINETMGDYARVAAACNQLAIVAKGAGRLEEAERWYVRAIELDEQLGNPKGLAPDYYSNLANLLFTQNRLDEAERYAHKAREIMETLDLSSQPWAIYNILARIATKRGKQDEAREWRRKEQETFAAFPGNSQVVEQFSGLINAIVAACEGNAQAKQELEPVLQEMGATDDWKNLIPVIHRVMKGERGDELYDDLDRTDALVIRRILGMLRGEVQTPPQLSPVASQQGREQEEGSEGGVTLEQLFELIERAAKGDQEVGKQLFPAMEKMAHDPNAPPEIRKLGDVLLHILIGDLNVNVDGLPSEMASAVRGLVGRVKANAK